MVHFTFDPCIKMNLMDIPHDILMNVMGFAVASTLIRAKMVCSWLRDVAQEVAENKTSWKDDVETFLCLELSAQRALAMLFEVELHWMLKRSGHLLHTDPGLLYFCLLERNVEWAMEEGEAMLVYDGEQVEWLHERGDYNTYDGDSLAILGLQYVDSRWGITKGSDYLAFTQHLALHPRYGRTTRGGGELLQSCMQSPDWWMEPLRAWIEEAPCEEREAFYSDAETMDAAVLLARFHWGPYKQRLHYVSTKTTTEMSAPFGEDTRLMDHEIKGLLQAPSAPSWQQRPSPFDVTAQRAFYRETFEATEDVASPFGGKRSDVLLHRGVGKHGRCWYRCTLSFFDALAKKSGSL